MIPDERLGELLRRSEQLSSANPGSLASVYATVEVVRRRRARGRKWFGALSPAMPAMAGLALALAVVVVVAPLVPALFPTVIPSLSARPSGSAATSPQPSGIQTTPITPLSPAQEIERRVPFQPNRPFRELPPFACSEWSPLAGLDDVLSPSAYAGASQWGRCTEPFDAPFGPNVQYVFYASEAELDGEYAAIVATAGVGTGGDCSKSSPGNSPWGFPGYPAQGYLACYARNGGMQYVWTDHGLGLLGQWLAPTAADGPAFWQAWTAALTSPELGLVQASEDTRRTKRLGACVRPQHRSFPDAIAIVSCPPLAGGAPVLFAGYDAPNGTNIEAHHSSVPFPDDPMTQQFLALLSDGGVRADTTVGCFEGAYGRYMWGYPDRRPGFTRDVGVVNDPAKAEGYIGCYMVTDGTKTTVRTVWTGNFTGLFIVWETPDLETALDYITWWIDGLIPVSER